MATVKTLELEIAGLEHDTGEQLRDSELAMLGARMGFAVARAIATQTILELSVKGVIPEGHGRRIITAVADAIDASCKRVTAK